MNGVPPGLQFLSLLLALEDTPASLYALEETELIELSNWSSSTMIVLRFRPKSLVTFERLNRMKPVHVRLKQC